MADWKAVAQGTSFSNLQQTVEDMQLPSGARIRIIMDTPGYDWIFNIAGAELPFLSMLPESTKMIDVWGENGQAIVELEATSPWLSAVVLGLPIWAWLVIGTIIGLITLGAIVAFIVVMIKVPKEAIVPLAAIAIGGGLALIGILAAISIKKGG